MNDLNIRITQRFGEVERSIDIDCYTPLPSSSVAQLPAGITSSAEPNLLVPPKAAEQLEWSATLCDGERVDYDAAAAACNALGEGWRLPTRIELLSIVDDMRHDPAIDTERFPGTKSGAYWTSTPCAWASSSAWIVLFNDGNSDCCHRDGLSAFVRAVRSLPAGQ